jgi:hypothetical protein
LKLIFPVVGDINEMGLFRILLNSPFCAAAVRICPATQIVTLARAT